MADWFLPAVLLGAALLLAWRLGRLREAHLALAEALRQRRPYLNDRKSILAELTGFEAVVREVNDFLSAANQARAADQEYFRQIEETLGAIQEGVLIIDDRNTVVLANPAIRRIFGGATIGQRVETLLQNAAFLEYLRALKRGDPPSRQVVEYQRGRERLWFEAMGARIQPPEAGGRPLTLFILHDITRQKQLERIRTDFVANVSHELRTPITIIKGFTDTLVEDHWTLPEEERERFLAKIQRNTLRLQRLLDDLLTLTRLESATERVDLKPQSLQAVLREIAENFAARKDVVPLPIEVVAAEGDDTVLADSLRLIQIVENLLDNALRHAKGATRLVLRTTAEGDLLRCAVEDDGCGIPARDLPNLFERFYRVDKGRSRERGGTGLGLSIVKHIVQLHGGEVGAESVEGRGTAIWFRLPRTGPAKTAGPDGAPAPLPTAPGRPAHATAP